MPLVTISLLEGKSNDYRKTVADAVNDAVIATLDFPEDDRYQLIREFASEDFELQEREGDRAVLELTMRGGRPDDDKQAFYARVAEDLAEDPGIPPENLMIVITENEDVDWSFRDGVAQFMTDE